MEIFLKLYSTVKNNEKSWRTPVSFAVTVRRSKSSVPVNMILLTYLHTGLRPCPLSVTHTLQVSKQPPAIATGSHDNRQSRRPPTVRTTKQDAQVSVGLASQTPRIGP